MCDFEFEVDPYIGTEEFVKLVKILKKDEVYLELNIETRLVFTISH
jgi:hypothetical protein